MEAYQVQPGKSAVDAGNTERARRFAAGLLEVGIDAAYTGAGTVIAALPPEEMDAQFADFMILHEAPNV